MVLATNSSANVNFKSVNSSRFSRFARRVFEKLTKIGKDLFPISCYLWNVDGGTKKNKNVLIF